MIMGNKATGMMRWLNGGQARCLMGEDTEINVVRLVIWSYIRLGRLARADA